MSDNTLTFDQQVAYNIIMSGVNTFVTGGAGVGKTHLLRCVIAGLEEAGKNVLVCAPTGAAAAHIGGITVHRAFGLPAGPCLTPKGSKIVARTTDALRAADVVITDEVSMVRLDMMDAIKASLDKIQSKYSKHIQLVVVGDFYQLPPVVTDNERRVLDEHYGQSIRRAYAFLSPAWAALDFRPVLLGQVMRQQDPTYADILNRLRIGDPTVIDYINTHSAPKPIEGAIQLYPYNSQVERANAKALDQIRDPMLAVIPVITDGDVPPGECEPVLKLKRDARVLITANDTGRDAYIVVGDGCCTDRNKPLYYNGSTGRIMDIYRRPGSTAVEALLIRLDNGPVMCMDRHCYPVYDYAVVDGRLVRNTIGHYYQFPVVLAYAMSIHRAQGQTYDAYNVEPANYIPGLLYVALSRGRAIDKVHIKRWLHPADIVVDEDVQALYASFGTSQ